MVLYYISQLNESSQLKTLPVLYDNDLINNRYQGIIEITLDNDQVEWLNQMFFYQRKNGKMEYYVDSRHFEYDFDSETFVNAPPPPNHTPCKDVASGLIEQMAYDITGNIHDIASFENITDLRDSVKSAIIAMKLAQIEKLDTQGTRNKPMIVSDDDNASVSIVHALRKQFIKSGKHKHGDQEPIDKWQAFQFHEGDCIAFNMKFKSPGKLPDNNAEWREIAQVNEDGTDITYSVRLQIDHCSHNTVPNSGIYEGY